MNKKLIYDRAWRKKHPDYYKLKMREYRKKKKEDKVRAAHELMFK